MTVQASAQNRAAVKDSRRIQNLHQVQRAQQSTLQRGSWDLLDRRQLLLHVGVLLRQRLLHLRETAFQSCNLSALLFHLHKHVTGPRCCKGRPGIAPGLPLEPTGRT